MAGSKARILLDRNRVPGTLLLGYCSDRFSLISWRIDRTARRPLAKSFPQSMLLKISPAISKGAPVMSEVKFECPSCGQHVQCETTHGGGNIPCPNCAALIRVPVTSAEAEGE